MWAPEQINFNQSWADEHGINSLQILTYLLSAYRVTGKEEYLEGWLVRGRERGVAGEGEGGREGWLVRGREGWLVRGREEGRGGW